LAYRLHLATGKAIRAIVLEKAIAIVTKEAVLRANPEKARLILE
jgi:hypothetical protein